MQGIGLTAGAGAMSRGCGVGVVFYRKKRSKNGESNGCKWVKKRRTAMVPEMYLVPW
jgi:hypothetical protein